MKFDCQLATVDFFPNTADVHDVHDVMYKYAYTNKEKKSLGLGLHGVL